MTPSGYDASVVARGDDTSNLVVNLPFAMNWNGTNYTQIYINMNGNCTFGSGYTGYNPSTSLAATNRNIMAPFWADVDTRNTAASQVTYSTTTAGSIPQVDGRNAFFVNWVNVARYNNQSTPTNSFQLVLVDRSDTGPGNFDFIYNYDQVTWDIATAASSYKARAGWGFAGTGFELPGSGVTGGSTSTLLDSSDPATSLIQNSLNSGGQPGRYVFQVRNGQAPNVPPQLSVTDRTLEGNAANSYVGYTGTGDVVAADSDGSIASLTSDMPSPLPLGITDVTWTATDDRGSVATAVQRVTVQDTTAPDNPTLTSPTHAIGVWTDDPDITAEAAGATDVCSGVAGMSYSWSSGSPETPDTTPDASTESPGAPGEDVTIYEQTFPTAAWPSADWERERLAGVGDPATYLRMSDVGSYAELWTNANNTRRTFGFYRDFDLAGYTAATLSYSDYTAGLDTGGTDYSRAEYSTDGGTSWTELRYTETNATWTPASFALPVGGTVRVRFSGSVNRTNEYCRWDDILLTGTTLAGGSTFSAADTASLADGTWYFNLHAVDNSGNWSTPVNLGPFLIDRVAPVTSDDAPTGWSGSPVDVALTADDAGQIAYTRYSFDGVTWQDYAGPIAVTAEGMTTLYYYSADVAGHVEEQHTTTVRIDTTAPSTPTTLTASALSTSTIEVAWSASTDAGSGVAGYRVYRDGVLVATVTELLYIDGGLSAGQTYAYRVAAIDAAGNESASSAEVAETPPSSTFWFSISDTDVDMGLLEPDDTMMLTSATSVTVGGVGELAYDLSCSASDFYNADLDSPTPFLPGSLLSFVTRGWATRPQTAFGSTPSLVNSSAGSIYVWNHDYIFDFSMSVPLDYEPGSYTSQITYTAVMK